MSLQGLPEIGGQSWLHALDDAALLLRLVAALDPPEPEWLPLPAADNGEDAEYRFESPMSAAEAREAVDLLTHCAIHIAVLQACMALESIDSAQGEAPPGDVRQAIEITRMIRDSYTEDPFAPVWRIDSPRQDTVLTVSNVIRLETRGLHGRPVQPGDYGGPDAVVKLLEFTRELLAGPDG